MNSIDMRKTIILLAAMLLALTGVSAQEIPFGDGEKIQYTVHYKYGISADLVSLTAVGSLQGDKYHVTANLNTFKFWDSFYKMRDRYETTFRYAPGLRPISAMRDVNEGGYWAKCNFTWGSDPKSVRCVLDKKDKPHRDTVLTDSREIRDIFNLIYYCRTLDFDKLEKGEPVMTAMAMDRVMYHITIRWAGRERKKVEGQWWNTVKVSIAVASGGREESEAKVVVDDGPGKLVFWVSDDANRIPVLFSANMKVGAVQGRMTAVEGNKYPLTAKE